MGLRILDDQGRLLVEGDLVHRASGGLRYVDFKAMNGNWTLEELTRVERVLRQEKNVSGFAFAHESGFPPPSSIVTEVNNINAALAADNIPKQIVITNVGTF